MAELENGVQGEYRDGVITISPTAKDPVRQVLVHELTHHLETSGLYDAFSQRVLSFMAEDSGSSIEQLRVSIAQDYAQAGKTLDADGAAQELVAAFCEPKLFTDEKSVRRLLHSDGNLFMRVYYWVRDMARKLRGTAEEKFLIDTQRMYEKALRSTGERRGYGDAQYSIKKDAQNKQYVDVDKDILDGVAHKDIPKVLADIIQNKFHNIIQANGQTFGVNADTNREWRWSRNETALRRRNPEMYKDKLRAFSNADELMRVSRDYVDEEPDHERKDKIVEFARGKVRFKVGKNGYLADVVVGIRNSGRAYFYDIVNLMPIKIADAPDTSDDARGAKANRLGTSADNSIIDGAQEVNTGAIQERRLSSARRGSSGKAGAHDADTQSSNGDYSPEQMISQGDAASQAKSDMQLAFERALGKQSQGQSSIGLWKTAYRENTETV